jgi:hypothetical protein
MYIISKYKDYYDGAVGMGIDKTIVYERKLNAISTPTHIDDKLSDKSDWRRHSFVSSYSSYHDIPNGHYNTYLIVIGFCGKLYPAIKTITEKILNHSDWDKTKIVDIMYDHDEIKTFMDKHQHKEYYWSKNTKTDAQKFDEYVQRLNEIDSAQWHREINSPIFVWGFPPVDDTYLWECKYGIERNKGINFFVNPILKDYKFAKVFDPYTAFQEVQMYVSGVLGVNRDGTEFPATEKQKVAQHGMDKWSFRKPPSK